MIVCKGAPFVTGVFITSRLNTHFLSTPPLPGQLCLLQWSLPALLVILLFAPVFTFYFLCVTICFCYLLLFLLCIHRINSVATLHYLWLLVVLFVTFYRPHLRQPYLLLLVFLPHLGLGSSLWLEGEPDISLLFRLSWALSFPPFYFSVDGTTVRCHIYSKTIDGFPLTALVILHALTQPLTRRNCDP